MTPKSSSVQLLDLFAPNSSIPICPYKEMGFLCFDGDGLTFVSVITPKSATEAAVFARTSTIRFDFKPPSVDEVTEISTSANGRFVSLVGSRCAFVAELPTDFWNTNSLFNANNIENLRPEYVARCEILNVNLVLSKRQYSVRKLVWLKGTGRSGLSNIVAILYSNSVIRIYDVEVSKSAPIAVADFQTILGCRTDDHPNSGGEGKRFGLITELVSFDFGPCLKHKDSVYLTLFAVDSDGEVFYSVNGTKHESPIEPLGPLKLEGRDPNRSSFYFNTSELLFVNHKDNSDVPVFAFCSDQGEMFHVVLVQTHGLDYLITDHKNIFEPTVIDSFQVEDWPLRNANVKMINDPDHRGEYFVISATEVYLVDPTAWIRTFRAAMDEPETSTPIDVPESTVRHYFKLVTSTRQPTAAISAFASIRIDVDGVTLDGADLTIFLVLDSSPHMTASFVQRRLNEKTDGSITKSTGRPVTSTSNVPVKPPLDLSAPPLRSLPKISTTTLDRVQRLDAFTKAINQTNEQLQLFVPHLLESQKKAEDLVHRFDHLDRSHKHCSDRLFGVFSDLHSTKNKLAEIKQKRAALEDTYHVLTELVESRIYTPSEAEDAHVEKLRESKQECKQILKRLEDISNKLIEADARYASGTKSFVASASAQKFMLSKHAVEIAQLQKNVDRATRDLNLLE